MISDKEQEDKIMYFKNLYIVRIVFLVFFVYWIIIGKHTPFPFTSSQLFVAV
jgi:hypothetical protein